MPQHPPPALGHWWPRRNPDVGAHCHPLGMRGGRVWLELHNLLLLWAHQPAFSTGLLRWFVGGAVTGQESWATGKRGQLCKALLPEQSSTLTMTNSQLGLWASLIRKPLRPLGFSGAGESEGASMDGLLCSRKRSLSQSKRGLREASGGLGLRPRSSQGTTPLHWSMRGFRSRSEMSSILLLLK